jgi:hypothetical protein
VPAFEFPPGLADADTIGIIYDVTDRRWRCPCRSPGPAGRTF